MASTTLFAPQVRDVQPAFIYDIENKKGEVKIYFSFSAYNNINDITHIAFTLIDPNLASGWGSNSMIQGGNKAKIITKSAIENKEFFTIDFFNVQNIDIFKSLNCNQFYQMQLFFINDSTLKEGIIDTNTLLKSDKVSEPSQATLIRPIPAASVFWDIKDNIVKDFKIDGMINYNDNSTIEIIQSYQYTLTLSDEIYYSSPVVQNTLGTHFFIDLNPGLWFTPFSNLKDVEFKLALFYTTINGFNANYELDFTFDVNQYDNWGNAPELTITNNTEGGYVHISCGDGKLFSGVLERTDENSYFANWHTLASLFNVDSYRDFNIESNKGYKYRLINNNNEAAIYPDSAHVTAEFEDIYLSDSGQQLIVRFNPKITNYKYVAQESITNTLGGIYPIVRRNGHTRYRQFTLSGALIFEYQNAAAAMDSLGHQINIQTRDFSSLYVNQQSVDTIVNYFTQNSHLLKLDNNRQREIYEKRMKDIAIDFLTNGQPKLFRSFAEGNMIVVLSNVNFTPNASTNRRIVDFSATVTELCDNNENNREKYGLNNIIYYSGNEVFAEVKKGD